MKNKYVFVAIMLCCILLISGLLTGVYVNQNNASEEDDNFVIVTSFYPMYIATLNIVKDVPGVTLQSLSEPQTGCLHDFQLTPEDMKLLSTADVFIINGGGIEAFMEQIALAYPELVIIEASEGLDLLCEEDEQEEGYVHDNAESRDENLEEDEHSHKEHNHDVNAHVWMSVSCYRKQVESIAKKLMELNPANTVEFERNLAEYDGKLARLEEKQQEVATLLSNQSVILFHSAFEYVAEDYGICVEYCMDLDEERQVSAGEVAEVLSVINTKDVSCIFAEELYGKGMCETIQKEVDVAVIYLDPLTRGEYVADSYIEAMSRNMQLIKDAFTK